MIPERKKVLDALLSTASQPAVKGQAKTGPANQQGQNAAAQNQKGSNKNSQKSNSNKAPGAQSATLLKNPRAQKPTKPNSTATQGSKARRSKNKTATASPAVKITVLGGINEIGKNLTVFECGEDMMLVDCGLAFPDEEMLGVDIVIPDFTFLEKHKDKIRGIVLTHGHEDHIGSLPFLLDAINVPIYGTPLTLGLVEGKLREHGNLSKANLIVTKPTQSVKLGCMTVEFIHVNHSIPDAVGLAIHTPAGIIVMTGDFKIDTTPIQGEIIDLARFAELGKQGVLALLSDSTNAERPGYAMTENKVGDSFDLLFTRAQNSRIIIATFASNIHRVQQIIDSAHRFGRKVALSGRSMLNVVNIALTLGYLKIPQGVLIDINAIDSYPKEKLVLITTGSQGEPMSALSRMAFSDHRKVAVGAGDLIIISATPIPGNEKLVSRIINELMKLGCEVVYEKMYEVHVSGHAYQEELKLMLGITKPKFFIPVHGEQKHLKKHANLALSMGIEKKNIILPDLGNIIELSRNEIKVTGTAQAGSVLVDGIGVGDVGNIVLRDRKHLAEDGLIVVVAVIDSVAKQLVSGPDIVSRGFVYVRESEKMMDDTRECAKKTIEACLKSNIRDWNSIKNRIKDDLSHMLYARTHRNPMILPVLMDV